MINKVKFFKRWLPDWTSFNLIGRSRIIRSSYLWLFIVPLLAKFLSKIGPEIKVPLWNSILIITLGLPFSWKMFYFSSVAFSFATLIYSAKCPQIIKDYSRYADFKDEGKSDRQIIQALISSLFPDANETYKIGSNIQIKKFVNLFAVTPPDGTTIDALLDLKIYDDKLSEAFWYVRSCLDKTGRLTRLFCSIFFATGFILISAVIIQNFIFVWRFVI